MLNRLDLTGQGTDVAHLLPRPTLDGDDPVAVVAEIIERVRNEGDAVLRELTERFDGVALDDLRVPDADLDAAVEAIPAELTTRLWAVMRRLISPKLDRRPARGVRVLFTMENGGSLREGWGECRRLAAVVRINIQDMGAGPVLGLAVLARFDLLGSEPGLGKVQTIDQHRDQGQDERGGAEQEDAVSGKRHRGSILGRPNWPVTTVRLLVAASRPSECYRPPLRGPGCRRGPRRRRDGP